MQQDQVVTQRGGQLARCLLVPLLQLRERERRLQRRQRAQDRVKQQQRVTRRLVVVERLRLLHHRVRDDSLQDLRVYSSQTVCIPTDGVSLAIELLLPSGVLEQLC